MLYLLLLDIFMTPFPKLLLVMSQPKLFTKYMNKYSSQNFHNKRGKCK